MKKFQVWLRGNDLCDIIANSKEEALQQIKDFYGYKRVPRGTFVCEIPWNYYDQMVKNNQAIGIDATNM